MQLIVKPRLQKDLWSLYWKVPCPCNNQQQYDKMGSEAAMCMLTRLLSYCHDQESMETKTEILENIQLALPPTATMAELQKEVEKKMGWEPTSKLER